MGPSWHARVRPHRPMSLPICDMSMGQAGCPVPRQVREVTREEEACPSFTPLKAPPVLGTAIQGKERCGPQLRVRSRHSKKRHNFPP